jgi:small-conductance mechanosensitive channel
VEDVRLTYTYIRLDDGRRLIVPNERLAQSSIANHTIQDARVQVEVSVWLPPDADLDRALELILDEDAGISASVAEADREGVRLSATTWVDRPSDRGPAASELRLRWLRLLREHGLSSVEAS